MPSKPKGKAAKATLEDLKRELERVKNERKMMEKLPKKKMSASEKLEREIEHLKNEKKVMAQMIKKLEQQLRGGRCVANPDDDGYQVNFSDSDEEQ